jgi:restriction endonuclease Mrr
MERFSAGGSFSNMHTTSFHRVALAALALGTAGLTTAFAQTATSDDTNAPADTGFRHFHHGESILTPAEQAELKQDFQNVMANPDIKTASANVQAQEKALREEQEALHKEVHAEIVAADPAAQAIFDKLKAAHQGHGDWHHHDDPSADATSNTSSQ